MANTVKRASRRPNAKVFAPAGLLGAASALLGAGAAQAIPAGALPQGATVVGGSAAVSQSGSTLTVNQSTNRTVIDWRNFDIGSGAKAVFNQPNSSSIAVNRVNASTDPTKIEGSLTANGQVWILNPNGVMFGKTATVNVAGLLASTANIDPMRFMAGDNRLTFTGADRGFVANDGSVTIAENGLAAFVAPSVRNSGVIKARVGKVTMAAGSTFTLDLAGDGLVELGLGTSHALVDQSGKIIDEGGVVTLSAKAAGQVVDSVINMSGLVSTASARQVGGEIILDGGQGQVQVAGTADASGTSGGHIAIRGQTINIADGAVVRADAGAVGDGGSISAVASGHGTYAGVYSARGGAQGGNGGTVETSGPTVNIADGIMVDTRAPAGTTGHWTLDPTDLTIGDGGTGTIGGDGVNSEGETISAQTVVTALQSTGVTLQAANSITVNSAIDSSAQNNANTLNFNDENADGHLIVNLNAAIKLGALQHLAGEADVVNVAATGRIQNGVDIASSNLTATENVAAGTYNEALDITKNIDIVGAGVGQTILEPTTLLSTGVGHKYDTNVKTALFVNGASDVSISGLTIDANNLGANAVVFWNNASGSLKDVAIQNPMAFSGAQTGQDLAVDATVGHTSTLTVSNTTFANWNKNAIDAVTGDGAGTNGGTIALTVQNSDFIGAGETNTIAQNGILAWEQGGGAINLRVDGGTFTGINYTGGDATAAGVLAYGVVNGAVTVKNSTFDGSVQDYISTAGGTAHEVDATIGNTFGGVDEASANLDQLFAIENHLSHGTEDSSTALVRVKAGNVYVTAAKGDIQDSIDAATVGDTVNIQAGTYRTQVVIDKDLSLIGAGSASTIIESPDVLTHGFTYNGVARNAVVSVEGADDVKISNLAIDGRGQAAANGAFLGLGLYDSGGTISDVNITRVRSGGEVGALGGGQTTYGFAAFNDAGSNIVTLQNSQISDFEKDGAAFYGNGLIANVTGNTITGAGATAANAQNGVVLYGASGAVSGNTISGIGYSPDTFWATAIYLNGASGTTTVSDNTVSGAGGLSGSTLGVYAGNGTGVQISNNSFTSVEEGIDLAANATVRGNTFKTSANGIEIEGAATGSEISGNTFTNMKTDVLGSDPAAVSGLLANNTFDRSVAATGGKSIYGDLQTAIDVEGAGSVLNLSGTFAAGANINQAGDTLDGHGAATIQALTNGDNGLTISANDITIKNLEIAGPATTSYLTYAWDGDITRGIVINSGVTGFDVTGNNIHGTRNDILVNGIGNTGSITGNTIDNSKSGISVQYTDGSGIAISNNTEGQYGNEWGVNLHLNGHYDSGTYYSNGQKIAADADSVTQAAILDLSTANHGMSVQDQGYANSNRTSVTVSTAGSDSNQGSALSTLKTIQAGIKAVVTGGTVQVNDGTYTIPAGGGQYIDITKSLTLVGQSEANTIIDARAASSYGMRVQADNVSLNNFTLLGSTGVGGYGIKVEPLETGPTNPNDRIHSFSISNVTEMGSNKNGLDLNGVVGATIDYVNISNTAAGTGIALTDSTNVAITNAVTTNNAWGGVALYQHNATYNQQTADITIDTSNSFGEAKPIYMEDESASQNFGAVNISGFGYAALVPVATNDFYTFFQTTAQKAIDLTGGLTSAYVEGWNGSGTNNTFTVGTTSGGAAMSLGTAITQASSGGTINVLDGTYVVSAANGYANGYLGISKSLALIGQSEAGVIIDARNASTYGLRVTASDGPVSLSNFTLYGVTATNGYGLKAEATHGLTIANVTSRGAAKSEFDLNGVVGATLDHLTANGASVGSGADTAGNGISFTDSQNITLTNATTLNNAWGGLALYQSNSPSGYPLQETGINVDASNSFAEANSVYAENQSTTNQFGALNIAGFDYLVKSPTNPADVYTWFQRTRQGAIDFAATTAPSTAYVEGYGSGVTGNNVFAVGTSTGGQALSIQAVINGAKTGATINIDSGSYDQSVTSGVQASYNLGSVNLSGGFILQAGAAGSDLSGQLTAGSIHLDGRVTLTGGLTLASSGAVVTGAIDGSAVRGQALTVNAGTASLGSLGASTQLGDVKLSGPATLTGNVYHAANLIFGSDVVLTAATTTFDTTGSGSAGDITALGSILGSSDGAQSLVLAAGPGAGSASANGDISLHNAGALDVRLGNMTVSGNDFTALTVDLSGNYTSNLTGNQVFAADTLNAGGSVSSDVGGNAAGHINAGQAVDFNVVGTLSGNIGGADVTLAANALNQATVNATGRADINAATVTGSTVTAAQNVNLNADQVTGSTLVAPTVTANASSFNGTVNASNIAAITGGNISGSFSGGSFKLVGTGSVTGTIDASNLSVQAPQGSVTGHWQSLDTTSSGGVLVNSQPVTLAASGTNPNQLVIENFALPAGTTVTPQGAIILPQGLVIGLLSPGGAGGAPKLIQVQTVQDLGSLLSQGYTAIVIDLSSRDVANDGDDKPQKLSQR